MKVLESFNYKEPALNLKDLIEDLGYHAQISETLHFNPNMVNNGSQYSYSVLVFREEFESIKNKLDSFYKLKAAELDSEYYLNDFKDAELFEIIDNPNAWSKYDFYKAYYLLLNREYPLNEDPDFYFNQAELKFKAIDFSNFQLIFLYSLLIIFGIIPALFALYVLQAKKSFSSGKRVNLYSNNAQNHAKIWLVLGIISFVILLTFRIFEPFN